AALAADTHGVVYESRGRQALRNVRDPVEIVAAVRQGRTADRGLVFDPVCRMAVDPNHAAGRLNYQDTAYYFCTLTCAGAFASRPDQFTN
ncbi:MAG: YHS domain-containing protein, partial [Solirubrobacteraceae bacterium]